MTDAKLEELEKFDKLKTKVLKYVLYKKRTEQEVRQKFNDFSGDLLDNVIEYLKQEGYIDDKNYIKRSINEIIKLKNLSIKEVKYKLLSKGLSSSLVENYISDHIEEIKNYEIQSAKNIIQKKSNVMDYNEIIQYLIKKGYTQETIKTIGENNE